MSRLNYQKLNKETLYKKSAYKQEIADAKWKAAVCVVHELPRNTLNNILSKLLGRDLIRAERKLTNFQVYGLIEDLQKAKGSKNE